MKVPLNAPSLGEREEKYVLEALRSGWTTLGPMVTRFEEEFAAYCGRKFCVATSSGTGALTVALAALELPAKSNVLTSAYTCDAVANSIIMVTGQTPLVIDVEPETWGMDADLIAHARPFEAVVVPHCYGVPSRDLERIEDMMRTVHIPMIEDASECHGAKLGSRRVGSFGDVSIFSMRGEKTLGAGQGGAVLTDDERLARKIRQYAHNGLPSQSVRYWATRPGLNFQASHLNAALAVAQLERIDELVLARNAIHHRWLDLLGQDIGLTFQKPHGMPAWWLTGILIGDEFTRMVPSDIALALKDHGIETRPGFYPLSHLPHCAGSAIIPVPVAETLLRRLLILPSGPTITAEQQRYVVERLYEVIGR